MTEYEDPTREPQHGFPEIPPGLAGILSFVAPGLGHFALRMWSRGAIWLTGWLVIGAASQASHSAPMLALMLIAGLDGYLSGRDRDRQLKAARHAPRLR